ncbi:MAG: energy-coupling factor transporter transmembrane protein EcfT, partial [Clostridia bacterium]|nr:energy-coupling factor transporter transmembrane protein EcfT [Clostridia bacterium]
DGNPVTLESVFYGVVAAGMLGSVMGWFSCYNEVMSSDKFVYLFGKIVPSLSLVFSMVLRFVPRLIKQFKAVANAQRGMGRDLSKGNLITRAKNGLEILSIVMTWALENAIDTADSMKARGYDQKGRTAYSIYTFTKRDFTALFWLLFLGGYTLVGAFCGAMSFDYFPMLSGVGKTIYSYSVFLAYGSLLLYPMILEIKERRTWSAIKSRI